MREKEKLQQAISPLPRVFSTCSESFLLFLSNLKLLSASSFSMEEPKIVVWEKVKCSINDYDWFLTWQKITWRKKGQIL